MSLLLFMLAFSFHASGAPTLDEVLARPIDQRVEMFRALGRKSYDWLAHAAFEKKSSLKLRWRAITTMGRLDPKYFQKDIDRCLQSPEWFMRNAALIALQSDDRERAIQWSSRLISDPALVVRTQAVRNLIQLDGREAEPLLWREIFSARNFRGKESLWVRVHMAEALARFTSAGHAKGFQRLLMESDERLYPWAILGLENTTGLKLGDTSVPLEVRRQQWLARLGIQEI